VPVALNVSLRGRDGGATAELGDDLAACLRASGGGGDKAHVLAPVICMAHGQASAEIGMDFCPTLTCNHEAPIAMHAVPYQDVTGALCAADGKGANGQHEADHKLVPVRWGWRWAVRRIMPVECERLQGFPDHYTRIPWRKRTADQCPDGPRYKALGNSWAVPNVRWIGARIALAVALAAQANDNVPRSKRGVA